MADPIPASEFTRNFGHFRMVAQREAVPVSSITGYFVGPGEYEEFERFRRNRQSFSTAELPEEKIRAVAASRMDARHADLDAILDEE
jgi:hypothetical protein